MLHTKGIILLFCIIVTQSSWTFWHVSCLSCWQHVAWWSVTGKSCIGSISWWKSSSRIQTKISGQKESRIRYTIEDMVDKVFFEEVTAHTPLRGHPPSTITVHHPPPSPKAPEMERAESAPPRSSFPLVAMTHRGERVDLTEMASPENIRHSTSAPPDFPWTTRQGRLSSRPQSPPTRPFWKWKKAGTN